MLMNIAELKQFVDTNESDTLLAVKLSAIESLIRSYTNNNFQHKGYRTRADVSGAIFTADIMNFKAGDTVMITESTFSDGELAVIIETTDNTFEVDKEFADEERVLVTKVTYPIDVKMGAANLLKWELENRDKVGISSETISRHSVTFFNMDGDNSLNGYPKSLLGFLKPYRKARF